MVELSLVEIGLIYGLGTINGMFIRWLDNYLNSKRQKVTATEQISEVKPKASFGGRPYDVRKPKTTGKSSTLTNAPITPFGVNNFLKLIFGQMSSGWLGLKSLSIQKGGGLV